MLELSGFIAGETEADLAASLEEIRKLIEEGDSTGASATDRATFRFEIKEV